MQIIQRLLRTARSLWRAKAASGNAPRQDTSTHEFVDAPIKRLAEDRLGRAGFAQALANILRGWSGDDSLAVALCGEYGSGKTSIKNMVLELLEQRADDKPYIREFNPWHWSTPQQIGEAFFQEIFIALGKSDVADPGKARARHWMKYARLLVGGSDALSLVSKHLVSIVATLGTFTLFGVAVGALTNAVNSLVSVASIVSILAIAAAGMRWGGTMLEKAFSATAARQIGVEELRQNLVRELRSMERSILVVIDDIDRLTEGEIRLVFQHVKANANFPRLMYLLIFERGVVEKSLTSKAVDGRIYLEKIVARIFDVPLAAQARVDQALGEGLEKILGDLASENSGFDTHRWQNLLVGGLRPFFRYLRDVNRFLGSFAVHVALFRGSRVFEVNPIDLIGLETLRVFEPELYRSLPGERALLTGQSSQHDNEAKSTVEKLVSLARPGRSTATQTVLCQLFPSLDWLMRHGNLSVRTQSDWTTDLRVCSPDIFDRYFALSIPDGDISSSEMAELIAGFGDRNTTVNRFRELAKRDLLAVALSRLYDMRTTLPREVGPGLVTALFDIGDEVASDRRSIVGPGTDAWRIPSGYLRADPDVDRRSRIFLDALRTSPGLYVPVILIELETETREKSIDSRELILTDEALTEARTIWLTKIEAMAAANLNDLLQNQAMPYPLYAWARLRSLDHVRSAVAPAIDSNSSMLRLIEMFTRVSLHSTSGDFVSRPVRATGLKELGEFASIDKLSARVAQLDVTSLTEGEARTVGHFVQALKSEAASEANV